MLEHRQKPKLNTGGIAAGQSDEPGRANGFAINLGKPIDRLSKKVGAGMRCPIPVLEFGRILEPKICRKIDDLNACG